MEDRTSWRCQTGPDLVEVTRLRERHWENDHEPQRSDGLRPKHRQPAPLGEMVEVRAAVARKPLEDKADLLGIKDSGSGKEASELSCDRGLANSERAVDDHVHRVTHAARSARMA